MIYPYVRRHFNRSVVCFSLALFTVSLHAQVNLTVNATQTIRMVDERVFGANSVIWDGEADNDQTISLLQAAGLRCVRIPGGSLSDEYHWRTNTARDYTWKWATGFDGFAKIVNGLNSQTFVSVNYGSGTAQEAAALVAYANATTGSTIAIGTDSKGYNWQNSGTWATLRASTPPGGTDDGMNFLRTGRASPPGLKYWEIGNECYGSWEYDLQAIPHDPTTYANRASDYIIAMKAVDPTIKIGVVVVTSGENANYKNWTPVMLARLKTLGTTPDFVIYHSYPQAPGSESDATLLQQANTWAASSADIRQQLTTYLGTAGSGVEIVVTENNSVYSDPGKQSTSLVNGLYLADSIANVMKTEINAFMWWAIRNGTPTDSTTHAITGNFSPSLYGWRTFGDYGMISTPVSAPTTGGATTYWDLHPTYYAMKLLSKFARGGDTVIQATSSSSLVSAFAVKRADGTLSLLVINKDPAVAQNATIALTGYTPPGSATLYTYGINQDNAAKPGGSGLTDIAVSTLSVGGSNFSTSFGPYSASVISFPVGVTPAISSQPSSQTSLTHRSVAFSVVATGVPSPSYQWRKNGVNISGATTDSYTIPSVSWSDAGNYSVVVANIAGSVTSQPAVLTVQSLLGDFDDDGKVDVLWQNTNTGERFVWLMNGTSHIGGASLGVVAPEWSMAATADFNNDGQTDLLWQNTSTGERYIWFMSGTGHLGGASLGVVPTVWSIVGTADFNGDGQIDILWQNTVTGERYVWLMSGGGHLSDVSLGIVATQWSIAALADFNGDNQTDFLWQNTSTGERYLWFMSGAGHLGDVSLGGVATQWSIANAADFNGDGHPDILWQNTVTGQRYLWLMNGTAHQSDVDLGVVDLNWKIVK